MPDNEADPASLADVVIPDDCRITRNLFGLIEASRTAEGNYPMDIMVAYLLSSVLALEQDLRAMEDQLRERTAGD